MKIKINIKKVYRCSTNYRLFQLWMINLRCKKDTEYITGSNHVKSWQKYCEEVSELEIINLKDGIFCIFKE